MAIVCGGSMAHAQGQPLPEKHYKQQAQFKLPIHMGDVGQQTIREVQLYVKHDGDPWVCVDKVAPTQKHFLFRAPQDGEYSFNIVTIDQTGKATPADVTRETPALIVVVDSTPPQLEMSAMPTSTGTCVIRCEAKDPNLAPGTLKVECQCADGAWMPLQGVTGAADLFALPTEKALTGLVRASVADLARNVATKEMNFKDDAAAAATKDESVPPKIESKSDKPVMPDKGATATGRQILNSNHVVLDYQIEQVGPSGVGRVEIWMTSDQGKTWKKLCEDKDRVSPADFDLPGEGVYGVTVVVSNGNGQGDPPPAAGDQPDCWIEVDTTKPNAQLISARPVQGDATGALHITWQATDKNLGPECVSLYYAAQRDGQWGVIAKGLHNDGSFRWSVPREVGPEFYIRMEVIDKAGNLARCELADKVVLDMSRPKAKVVGVAAGTPHAPAPPTGN
jgi:hypothetical protein